MFKKIWAFLTGGKVVWLEDFDGEVTRTIAYQIGKGKMQARLMSSVRKATLESDGSVSYPSYVKKWWYE